MIKKSLLLIFLMALVCPLAALAQSISVTGKVISSEDGLGMPGVTIQVKSTQKGTVTDFDGNYTLSVGKDDVLVFSFVGYKTQEVKVAGKTKINVTMDSDALLLDDVVVTALGIKRQKRELGYATEEIGGEMIAKSGSG
ncbi:MAG: carboxypeptidase-like regulatory domain-containing protein, partial [Bacteroidales bacterium]|nr:carboxypeptidase-like regulatory domain-containing protein [Bacteroidales bacterium]